MFTLNQDADIDRTSNVGTVVLSPRQLVACFGPPGEADGHKVSGMYVFEDDQHGVFTVYDWKQTKLFGELMINQDPDSVPSPDEFWASEESTEMSIGGRKGCDVERFKTWLRSQIEAL